MNFWTFLDRNGIGVLLLATVVAIATLGIAGAWAEAWSKAHEPPHACKCEDGGKK